MEVEVSGEDSGCGMALVRELWRPKVHCGSAVSGELTVEGAVVVGEVGGGGCRGGWKGN